MESPAMESQTIDVRSIPPRDRHAQIFGTFNDLDARGTLIVVNDHDPAPLRNHFTLEYGSEAYTWEYLEQGPDRWMVKVTKAEDKG